MENRDDRRSDPTSDRREPAAVDAAVLEDVAVIKETLRWHKWLLLGLVAATLSPKVGGPAPADLVASLLQGTPGT